ncbi:hypothetical protein BG011_008566 [Mortierella polycephala]|uniref:Heparan-alpha-glucosaminide N-acetyltransferase catalytic domain-containing protein n=1 Tax=Mortierella polycephala TaxID=41804 RepID=A0A9P6PPX9_9FUNG|nr:hypothetical protein BG011_008566 [Mortierella polycephala]
MEHPPQVTGTENRQDPASISALSPVSSDTAVVKDVAPVSAAPPATTSDPAPVSGIKKRLQLSSNRLLSLDLLRGLAILLMITCNSQAGDEPFPILYSVFPSFLFITGCALPLSVRADPNPTPGSHYYRNNAIRVFKRALMIWLLGIILNLPCPAGRRRRQVPLARVPEQPLSFSYLFTTSASTPSHQNTTGFDSDTKVDPEQEPETSSPKQDERQTWPWFVQVTLPYYLPVGCLVIWLICTFSVQVEGCPERAMILEPECSPQAYFDLKIFGKAHTYRHKAYDPEGALSTLTSILNVWFGWFIGCTVRTLNAQVKQLTNDFKARRQAREDTGADDAQALMDEVLEQEMLASWTATFAVFSAGISQTVLAILFYKFDAQPKMKRLEQLHRDHQAQRSGNQLSRHDIEQPLSTGADGRSNYSSTLNLYFKVDHFFRHWFRRSIVVVLGSMGRNAILLYMCSELVLGSAYFIPAGPVDPTTGKRGDLFSAAFDHTWGALDIGGWGALFFALGFAALHVLLAIFLDHKKWYFKV